MQFNFLYCSSSSSSDIFKDDEESSLTVSDVEGTLDDIESMLDDDVEGTDDDVEGTDDDLEVTDDDVEGTDDKFGLFKLAILDDELESLPLDDDVVFLFLFSESSLDIELSDEDSIYYEYNLYSCNTLLIFVINSFFSKLYGLIDSKHWIIVFHSILLTSVT